MHVGLEEVLFSRKFGLRIGEDINLNSNDCTVYEVVNIGI